MKVGSLIIGIPMAMSHYNETWSLHAGDLNFNSL